MKYYFFSFTAHSLEKWKWHNQEHDEDTKCHLSGYKRSKQTHLDCDPTWSYTFDTLDCNYVTWLYEHIQTSARDTLLISTVSKLVYSAAQNRVYIIFYVFAFSVRVFSRFTFTY